MIREHRHSAQAQHTGAVEALEARLKSADTAAQRWRKKLSLCQAEVKQLRAESRKKDRALSLYVNNWETHAQKTQAVSTELHEAKQILHEVQSRNRRLATVPGTGGWDAVDTLRERTDVLSEQLRRQEAELASKDGLLEMQRRENAALKEEMHVLAHAVDLQRQEGEGAEGATALSARRTNHNNGGDTNARSVRSPSDTTGACGYNRPCAHQMCR